MWRRVRGADLDGIKVVADEVHPNLCERREVLAEKFRLFPQGCFVLVQDGKVVGYAFVHPWRINDVPKLDDYLLALPAEPECLFIHDVALLPTARGKSASKSLIDEVLRLAKIQNVATLSLVSVYGSNVHWARLGFEIARDQGMAAKLASYGQNAYYMVRRLGC
jgi:GNAT superfamily N-acetyltransferase